MSVLKYYSGGQWIPAGQPDPLYAKAVINDMVYPVGSIYINATDDTNPAELLGVGTWVAWGVGKAIVGIDTGDTDFDTPEETGGEKEHTLSLAEIPNVTGQATAHSSRSAWWGVSGAFSTSVMASTYSPPSASTGGANSVNLLKFNLGGGGGAHNNLQPYQVGYVWKRTA